MGSWKDLVEQIKARKSLDIPRTRFLKPETKLRPYQNVGAFILHQCVRFLLADDCGLGKSIQTLMSFALRLHTDEKEGKPSPKLLIVTTKSSVLQWAEEVEKFFTGISVLPIPAGHKDPGYPSTTSYRRYLYQTAEENIIALAQQTFTKDWRKGAIQDLVERSILVLDEATYVKDENSQAFKAFKAAVQSAKGFKALTATPIKKDLKDYYNLMEIICPGLFGTLPVFHKAYCVMRKIKTPSGMYIPMIKDFKNIPQFKERAKHYFLMRTPEDVGEQLPETLEKPVFLDMEDAQAKAYADAENLLFNLLPHTLERRKDEDDEKYEKRIKNTKDSPMVKQMRMLQVCDHPRLVGVEAPSAKTERLIELLQGQLHRDQVVVYTRFKECVDLLEVELKAVGIETCRVTGDESAKERQAAKKALESPGPPYVMLVTGAGKESLNLQCAGTVIFYELPWAWGDFHQIVGRLRRIGSTRSSILVAMLMIRGTVDEIIYRVLKSRAGLVTECTDRGGLMEVTPLILEEILAKIKAGKKIKELAA